MRRNYQPDEGQYTYPKVLHRNSKRIQNLGINSLLLQINQIHLFPDLLHSRLRTKGSHVSSNKSMCLGSNLLQIHIIRQLHILGVDTKDLKTTGRVRNTDIDFTIETAESTKSGVDTVGTVGGSNDDNIGAGFETVHERQELGDDTSFNFTVGLMSGDG